MLDISLSDPYSADVLSWYIARMLRSDDGSCTSCDDTPIHFEARCIRNEAFRCTGNGECTVMLGTGCHHLRWKGRAITLRKNAMGTPIALRACYGEPPSGIHEVVTVSCDEIETVLKLIDDAKRERNKIKDDNKFGLFKWSAKHGEWERDALGKKRSVDSVVLDARVKLKLYDDVDDFTSTETSEWYTKHCIPYKRGYLLHGPPGTGKTSTVLAASSRMGRDIYRMSLSVSGLDDASLMSAVANVPVGSVILLEDVDALFGRCREKENAADVSFSGLLNALDGVNDYARGLIFFITTNHVDRLDDALVRPGRIDVSLRLGVCTDAQIVEMFERFYPEGGEHAKVFLTTVRQSLGDDVTPALLQNHFIQMRKKGPKDASSCLHVEANRTQNRAYSIYV